MSKFFSFIALACCSSAMAQDVQWDAPGAIKTHAAVITIKNQVDVTVEIPGKIETLKPDYVGGRVAKGDEVVTLISERVDAELKELELLANSNVLIDYAQKKLDLARKRLQNKIDKNVKNKAEFGRVLFPEEEIEELELAVLEGEAELAKAKQDKLASELKLKTKQTEVAQYSVKAPMDGVVTDLHLKSVGSGVRQGDPILTIVDLKEVTVQLNLYRDDEARVTIGDKVVVRRRSAQAGDDEDIGSGFLNKTSMPGRNVAPEPQDDVLFEGEIVFIVPKVESEKAPFKVQADIRNRFVNNKYLLREGTRVEAQVIPAAAGR